MAVWSVAKSLAVWIWYLNLFSSLELDNHRNCSIFSFASSSNCIPCHHLKLVYACCNLPPDMSLTALVTAPNLCVIGKNGILVANLAADHASFWSHSSLVTLADT